jgi:hypothetical protein
MIKIFFFLFTIFCCAEDFDVFFKKSKNDFDNKNQNNDIFFEYLVENSLKFELNSQFNLDFGDQIGKIIHEDMTYFEKALSKFLKHVLNDNNIINSKKLSIANEISRLKIENCNSVFTNLVSLIIQCNQYQYTLHENRKQRVWGGSKQDEYDLYKGFNGPFFFFLSSKLDEVKMEYLEKKLMQSHLSNQNLFVFILSYRHNKESVVRLENIINCTKNLHIRDNAIKSLNIINQHLIFKLESNKNISIKEQEDINKVKIYLDSIIIKNNIKNKFK